MRWTLFLLVDLGKVSGHISLPCICYPSHTAPSLVKRCGFILWVKCHLLIHEWLLGNTRVKVPFLIKFSSIDAFVKFIVERLRSASNITEFTFFCRLLVILDWASTIHSLLIFWLSMRHVNWFLWSGGRLFHALLSFGGFWELWTASLGVMLGIRFWPYRTPGFFWLFGCNWVGWLDASIWLFRFLPTRSMLVSCFLFFLH